MSSRSAGPGPFAVAFGWSALLALSLWSMDFVVRPPAYLEDALSSMFLLLLVCMPLAPVLGLFFRVVLGSRNPYDVAGAGLKGLWRGWWSADDQAGFLFLNQWLWTGVWALASMVLSVKVGTRIGYEVVRPNYQTILTLAAAVALTVALLPLRWFLIRAGAAVAPRVASTRYVRYLWRRKGTVLALALLAMLAAGALFVVKFWEAVRLSPWQTPALLLGAMLAATALAWPLSRLLAGRRGSVGVALGMVVLVTASCIAVATLDTKDRKARLYFLKTKATRLAYSAAIKLFDTDGDGFMHQFAGGDCNPDDPGISPSALDIPGNEVDEDCDGRDVPLESLERGRFDFDLPEYYAYEKPNVVIISIDSLAASHVGFMGYERNTTPHMDQLAENCVVFEQAFAQGPSTRLSVASLFTSKYDSQIAQGMAATIPYPLLPENETMAELFKKNGYDTVAVLPHDYFTARWKGILQGFDTIDTSSYGKKGGGKHNAEKVTKAALKELRKKRTRPVFAWIHYWDVHPPFFLPKNAKAFGKKEKVDIYDSEVRFTDERLAPLLDDVDQDLRKQGYILIVTADHGSAFDKRHTKHTHGHDLYTNVLHVPLMVCMSTGMEPRRVVDTPVSLLDLLPTLVNLTGIKVGKSQFEGTSLVPLLFHPDEEWPDRYLFHQFFLMERSRQKEDPLMMVGVRTHSYNYIWQRSEDQFELYDYQDDPDEEYDILDESPEIGLGLNAVMHNWLARVHQKYNPQVQKEAGDESEESEEGAGDDYTDEY